LRTPPTAVEAPTYGTSAASLGNRISAYVIDSVVLLGFVLAVFTLAGLVLWLSSNLGKEDPPDAAYYAFMAIFIGGTLIAWSAFNIVLALLRGQTAGQYVAGLRITSENGQTPSAVQTLLRWFALNPLLFHPLLIPVWALFATMAVSLTMNQLVLVLTLGLASLCVVAPSAALITALLDRDGRSLHDRVSGTLVTSSERQ